MAVTAIARRGGALALAFALCFPHQAASQPQFQPLEELLGTAASTYPFVRCAALYQSVARWAGAARLGQETFDNAVSTSALFLYAAAIILSEETAGPIGTAAENVTRSMEDVVALYIQRFEFNFAIEGQAFANDLVVTSDLELCRLLGDTLAAPA